MATKYKNPLEAETALTSAFAPTNPVQAAAIKAAAALVPGGMPVEPTPSSIYSGIGGGAYGTSAINDASLASAQFAQTGLSTKDQNAIRQSTLASFQAEIDAQNELYANKLKEAQAIGANRIGSGTAIAARRGLLGSDFGTAQANTIVDANQQVYNSINAEKAAATSAIMGAARKASMDAIKEKTAAKQAGLDAYLKYLQDGATRQEANAGKAAKLLLSQGQTMADLAPVDLQALLNGYGITKDALSQAYQAAQAEGQFELGKGQKRFDAKGNLIASGGADLPASAQEYEYAVAQGYKGTFSQYQNEDANRKAKASGGGIGGLLTSAQMNSTINQIAQSFDNEPIVKSFNVLKQGYDFASSMPNNTTNPADDQGLIYAFAKASDPESVVREGEYQTVQKYSQGLVQAYGASVNQAINGTGFLTPEARENLKKAIRQRYEASKKSYENVYNQYQARIDQVKSGEFNSLTRYQDAGSTTDPAITAPSQFDDIAASITIEGNKAYIPRSVWSTLGARQDALLAEAAADGYELLVK